MDPELRVMAYVDGELDAAERAAFERELAADPALQREVAREERLRAQLNLAYAPVLDEPVPSTLTLAAQTANDPGRGNRRVGQWAVMAACLVLGVLVGRAALPDRSPVASEHGALQVRGEIAQALDQRLAADAGAVRVGVSFRSKDGRWCRTFQSAPQRLAGVACRDDDGWRAQALAPWKPDAHATYRTAGSETPAPVLAAIDDLISGQPLDAAAERAARDRGWRP